MAHAGDELGLVLARHLQLTVLVLDFVEQPGVLDRDCRLVGEGGDQLDLLVREGRTSARDSVRTPIGSLLAQHRNGEHGAIAAQTSAPPPIVFRVGLHIGNVDRPCPPARPVRSLSRAQARTGKFSQQFLNSGESRKSRHKRTLPSICRVNRRIVGVAKPGRRFDKRLQHRLEIEGRAADDLEHVGGGGLLLKRLANSRVRA